MFPNCFQIYYQPVYIYIKRSYELAVDNGYALTYFAAITSAIGETIKRIFDIQIFGVSNLLLLFVIGTVLIDAFYGVQKSVKQSKEAYVIAQRYDQGTPERRKWLKVHELKKFKPQKLQFTFFKCCTLLFYLFMVKNLLASESDDALGQILGFTSAVVLKAPLIIFWYYDFKSIGDNSAYVYGKKAPIFTIVEKIFEPKISKFFKSNKDDNGDSI
ncbi:MAG: hypothetical protein CMH22_01050 [Methylophaga sp.]|nr:hypothetical protein [Methylophaga sp.]MAY34443.1 hypothetical protein [Rhodovulum sp.]|tara:strand:+ start:1313 stop:1957 length:645 start_codon:yes stop_codon:yes gene_type:complete